MLQLSKLISNDEARPPLLRIEWSASCASPHSSRIEATTTTTVVPELSSTTRRPLVLVLPVLVLVLAGTADSLIADTG
jgi:hypothetical protein